MGKRTFSSCFVATLCATLIFVSTASAQADRNNAGTLMLRAGEIDLRTQPSLLRSIETIDPSRDYLLQLDGPMTPARRDALEEAGVALGDYIPHHAWRVELDRARLELLDQLDFVVWLGTFDSTWKLCPNIKIDKRYETVERQSVEKLGRKRVIAHLAIDADANDLRNGVYRCNGKIIDKHRGNRTTRFTIDLPAERIGEICHIAGVRFIEEAPEAAPRNSSTEWIAQSNIPNVTSIWDQGLHGEGQLIGLIDWDLDENHCAFFDKAPFGDTHRKIQSYYGFNQNTLFGWHGTHVAGTLLGEPVDSEANENLFGMAFASRLVFQDQAATITAINLGERLTIAHEDGARVHSNSWGATFDNSYNAWAHDIDDFTFANEDDIVIFAVINGGAATPILSPENAKNCLAVGATGDDGNQDALGSGGSGPTTDGRQKPEVWIPGCTSNSAEFGTACGVIQRSCATSWAAPAVSGLAALARQYFVDGFYPTGTANSADSMTPSGALLKAILINSAVDMSGFAGYFGPHEGWGRLLLGDALFFGGDARKLIVYDVRHANGLDTNTTQSISFDVTTSNEPLKITLVWNDAPATVGAAFAPVNNLDLVVTAPNGETYLGNNFAKSQSQTGGAADQLNNAEQVHRLAPVAGTWRVDVVGTEVNVGSQGFALAITGDVAPTGGPESDIAVSFDPVGPLDVMSGDEIDAKLIVSNLGPDVATNVNLELMLPAGLTLVMPDTDTMDCTVAPTGLSCSFADLRVDDSLSIAIQVRVDRDGAFMTTATVASDSNDPMAENNSADLLLETEPTPDLEIVSIIGPDELVQGTVADYTVTVRNNGRAEESTPSVKRTIAAGLTVESVSGCADMPDEITCSLVAISAGSAVELVYSIRAATDATGQLDAMFTASGRVDANPDDNIATKSITILADADMDGVADVQDVCKGFDDGADTDADGTPDGCDECPTDPAKTLEGICGCGVAETDDDGDGVPNCGDLCPNDPDKVAPGDCGCGASDEDTNENGVPDCLDTPVPMMPGDDIPPEMFPDIPADQPFRLEDLDPCFVRFLLQSFLGIPLCGPCISFGAIGSFAGISVMRRRIRKQLRRRR